MNILITGCAGFIGFHSVKKFLLNSKNRVIGIDSINGYYSTKIKLDRIKILKKNKNFKFYKLDLINKNKVNKIFLKYKIDNVIHLAAQAGVRYSILNPRAYFDSNIKGFINLIDISQKKKVKKFIFASSSSVYGDQKKFPLKESFEISPKNIYAASKKLNEQIAYDLSNNSITKYIGLRFFTVYGNFGRPDMLIFKFLEKTFKNENFYLNNFGGHYRDFTHIDDVTNILEILIKKKINKNFYLFNLCSGNSINILDLINEIKKITKINTKIIKIKRNNADVLKTHGSNVLLKNFTKYKKFKKIFQEIGSIVEWYKLNKFYKNF